LWVFWDVIYSLSGVIGCKIRRECLERIVSSIKVI
jgi:hypothetical protein